MDDTPGSGTAAHRAAPEASAGPSTGGARGGPSGRAARTKAVPAAKTAKTTTAAKAAKATKTTKAAKATKATKATPAPRAPRAAGSGRAGAGAAGAVSPERPGGADRHPGRSGRSRALYSRRLQRADERWAPTTRAAAALLRRPELVLKALGKTEPVERDGRVLNRGVQALIELAARFGPRRDGDGAQPADPVEMRRQLRYSARLAMPVRTDVHAWGRVVPGPEGGPPVPVRLYRRFGSGLGLGGDDRLVPAIVYYHGGGWVTGDLDTHDASCRMLATVARCLVVAVDYRLAPEHPFPAAVDDALAAYAWVHRHAAALGVDPRQVGVMGDSAGGNLAAVVALEARTGHRARALPDDVLPPAVQGLVYPALDARLDSESVRTLGEGFFLTLAAMEHFRALYLPDPADWTAGRASPLLAEDHRGVAPAMVVTAGFDPLRDDGSRYAERLAAAGVEVEYRCYDDQVHGFLGMGILPDSLALATEVFEAMGRLIRRGAAAGPPA